MDERDLDVPVTVGAPLDERQGGEDPFGVGTRAASASCWFLGARLDGCACRAAFQLAGFPDHDTENDEQYASCNGSRRRAEIVGADTSDHCSDHESAHHRTEAEGLLLLSDPGRRSTSRRRPPRLSGFRTPAECWER